MLTKPPLVPPSNRANSPRPLLPTIPKHTGHEAYGMSTFIALSLRLPINTKPKRQILLSLQQPVLLRNTISSKVRLAISKSNRRKGRVLLISLGLVST